MINLGSYYDLQVVDKSHSDIYLDAKNLGKITLDCDTQSYADINIGDTLNVFLYQLSKGDVVATLKKGIPAVGEFAFLPFINSTEIGAFLDWGIDKDLFVPLAEQHREFENGKSYLVYIYLDKVHNRPTATSKINKHLTDFNEGEFIKNQEVDLIIGGSSDIGYRAIINNSRWGVLYKAEVFQRLSFGQSVKGYIKNIRDDGKIDLCLQLSHKDLDKNAKYIKTKLEHADGFLPFHDKSDANLIKNTFGISKAAFKKAIGTLYKQKLISLELDGIRLKDRL